MLGQIADGLACGFEKEARNRADQLGQNRTNFRPYRFEAISKGFAGCPQSVSDGSNDSPDGDTAARTTAVRVMPFFLKISYILSRRGRTTSLSSI